MSSQSMDLAHRPQQALAPRLQRAVRLLQLSSLDFALELKQALNRNPFLEGEDDEPVLPADGADGDTDDDVPPSLSALAMGGEADGWPIGERYPTQLADDGEAGLMNTTPAQTSLAAHLHGQVDLLKLPPRDRALAKAIVDSLDDDGYLRASFAELAPALPLDPLADEDELRIALRRVQALDPTGVGARDLQECLLLQLSSIEGHRQRDLIARIVRDHLPALAAHDIGGLARKLRCTAAEVDAACHRIRRLDPHPGWRFGGGHAPYVTPDVIARRRHGQWTAILNPSVVPRVRLNRACAELFQRHRRGEDGEMAAQLHEARWTLRNVEQRFSTIVAVAQAILDRQHPFLDFGPMAMKPLALRDIAEPLGLHESTVSRVTNNKYIATPAGVFELKHFFSRAMTSASGQSFSPKALRGLVKEMIEEESPGTPLSDAEIARRLARQGLVVARRTITKYRQALRIDAVERRRVRSAEVS